MFIMHVLYDVTPLHVGPTLVCNNEFHTITIYSFIYDVVDFKILQ